MRGGGAGRGEVVPQTGGDDLVQAHGVVDVLESELSEVSDRERKVSEQLCTEFDQEHFVPRWMKERADRADREAYLRFERHELRN